MAISSKTGQLATWSFESSTVLAFSQLALETLGIWNLGAWVFGNLDTWTLGYLDTWTFGHLDTWVFGHLDTWVFGHLDTWVFGHLDTSSYTSPESCTGNLSNRDAIKLESVKSKLQL